MQKIIVTGATGLVGSRFVELFKGKYDLITVGRQSQTTHLDLLNTEEIEGVIAKIKAEALINFAAFTNVDEAQKQQGNKEGDAYKLNVLAPFFLAKSCLTSNKKMYHVSTDYVFDGTKEEKPYTEEDLPHPVASWYAQTKAWAEEKVNEVFKNNAQQASIVRISFPYSGVYNRKLDIARAVIEKLKNNREYFGISDQKITPTSVEDIAVAFDLLLTRKAWGIYHAAGSYPNGYTTPYKFACKLAQIFGFDSSLIKPVRFADFVKTRLSPRPQHTWLDTTKIQKLGMRFTSEEDALLKLKKYS